MSAAHPLSTPLPEGWFYPDTEEAQRLLAELGRELPPKHLLAGVAVEVFAWRQVATDDVLFRHRANPEHFTIVHLSWRGRTEINVQYPSVEFDGSFDGFLAWEERLHGGIPPESPARIV